MMMNVLMNKMSVMTKLIVPTHWEATHVPATKDTVAMASAALVRIRICLV